MFAVRSGLPLIGIGAFDKALTPPDEPADIQFIIEDTIAALAAAANGRAIPGATLWSGDTLSVERYGDFPGGVAACVGLIDPDDNCSLVGVDRAVATLRMAFGADLRSEIISVGIAASVSPTFCPSSGPLAQFAARDSGERAPFRG